jgi:hypothetical protein
MGATLDWLILKKRWLKWMEAEVQIKIPKDVPLDCANDFYLCQNDGVPGNEGDVTPAEASCVPPTVPSGEQSTPTGKPTMTKKGVREGASRLH